MNAFRDVWEARETPESPARAVRTISTPLDGTRTPSEGQKGETNQQTGKEESV